MERAREVLKSLMFFARIHAFGCEDEALNRHGVFADGPNFKPAFDPVHVSGIGLSRRRRDGSQESSALKKTQQLVKL
jgi:hypothetical protein